MQALISKICDNLTKAKILHYVLNETIVFNTTDTRFAPCDTITFVQRNDELDIVVKMQVGEAVWHTMRTLYDDELATFLTCKIDDVMYDILHCILAMNKYYEKLYATMDNSTYVSLWD